MHVGYQKKLQYESSKVVAFDESAMNTLNCLEAV